MSVKYDIVYRDNRRIPMQGACFGGFATYDEVASELSTSGVRRHDMTRLGLDMDTLREFHTHAPNASFVQYYPEVNCSWGDNEEAIYYSEVKAILKECPWLKASVHPLLKVIRVPVKDTPADKVMMTLFLVRNLATMTEYIMSYKRCRELGLRALPSAVLAHIFRRGGGSALSGGGYAISSVGEYNWVSPSTFGKQAFINLLTSGADWSPWFQNTWGEQRGYHRDSYFDHRRITFGTGRQATPRRLIDCLSVPSDEFIWPDLYDWSRNGSGQITGSMSVRTQNRAVSIAQFETYVIPRLQAVAREVGQSIYEDGRTS